MSQKEAVSTFDISCHQVQRIIKEDPLHVKVNKQRPLEFNNDMVTNLLMFINQRSTTTLKEMVKFLKNKHEVIVTTKAINNILRDIEVTWKEGTNIPAAWN